jgi:hypothetical protein
VTFGRAAVSAGRSRTIDSDFYPADRKADHKHLTHWPGQDSFAYLDKIRITIQPHQAIKKNQYCHSWSSHFLENNY